MLFHLPSQYKQSSYQESSENRFIFTQAKAKVYLLLSLQRLSNCCFPLSSCELACSNWGKRIENVVSIRCTNIFVGRVRNSWRALRFCGLRATTVEELLRGCCCCCCCCFSWCSVDCAWKMTLLIKNARMDTAAQRSSYWTCSTLNFALTTFSLRAELLSVSPSLSISLVGFLVLSSAKSYSMHTRT